MNGSSKQANKRIELANRKHDEIDIKKQIEQIKSISKQTYLQRTCMQNIDALQAERMIIIQCRWINSTAYDTLNVFNLECSISFI